MARTRNFCFTINNYSEQDEQDVQAIDCKYVVYGREVGEAGTPHLQGFICFPTVKSFNQIKKLMPRAHIEAAKTIEAAIMYCKKDGNWYEAGEKPMSQKEKGQKGAEFWDKVLEQAKRGDLDEIDSKTLIAHYPKLKMIAKDYAKAPPDLQDVCGFWITGPPGTGKSHCARNDFGPFYLKETNKWWDSYRGEPAVIIDEVELDAGKYIGHYLKKWADKYAFDAEIKGSKMIIRPEYIIVTSNYTIEEVFAYDEMMMKAIQRRFTVITKDTVYQP